MLKFFLTSDLALRSTIVPNVTERTLVQTKTWIDTVTSGNALAARQTADLYAPNAVLWGTFSQQVRTNHTDIYEYFTEFTQLPDLQVTYYKPFVRNLTPYASNDGYYTFEYKHNGTVVQRKARFSMLFRESDWLIVDHHSSLIPST